MPVFSLGLTVDRDASGRWVVMAEWLDGALYGETWYEVWCLALKAYSDASK